MLATLRAHHTREISRLHNHKSHSQHSHSTMLWLQILLGVAGALGHETGNDKGLFPINPGLGVSGFPDCVRWGCGDVHCNYNMQVQPPKPLHFHLPPLLAYLFGGRPRPACTRHNDPHMAAAISAGVYGLGNA